jgi:hypothetical protein
MHLIYLGCVITNFFAFQEFINYPLTYQEVTTAYHKALNKDMLIMKYREKSTLNLAYFPEAEKLLYPSTTAQILWVNKDDYPKEMCVKLSELQELPDIEPRFRYASLKMWRGCFIANGELHKEICRYINYFNPEELRLKAIAMRVKAEMKGSGGCTCDKGWKGDYCTEKEEEEVDYEANEDEDDVYDMI